ncbi:MAG: hypothetical protein ABEK75_01775 [Salinibacter sp.]
MHTTELFDPSPSADTPIACDLSVLDEPRRHKEQFESLFQEREEVRKVEGGLAVRFPGATRYAERALDFISRERKCCPFLTFQVAVEPEQRGVWLYMGGDEPVEDYLTGAFEHTWMDGAS